MNTIFNQYSVTAHNYGVILLKVFMRKKIVWLLGSFILLMALFYLLLFAGTDYYKVKLPVINYVQDFSFTDQNGKTFTERNVEGKVYVAEYFFTTCKGICPKMNRNMKKVYDKFKAEEDFAIVSHTSMPETDSVPLLKAYEQKMLSDSNTGTSLTSDGPRDFKWYFVTGTKDSLYKMARESYLLDNDKNNSINIKEQFIHTQFFALVDKQKRVRGIYDGLKEDELQKLEKDIKGLLNETTERTTFSSPFTNNPG